MVEFNYKIIAAPQDIESEVRRKINPPSHHKLNVRDPDFGLIDFHFEDVEDRSRLLDSDDQCHALHQELPSLNPLPHPCQS